ncbi:MAG: protein kinase [Candidatus Latescibacterota bacterium]|nr:MAG: protein kinase [Candidatus Latescibacterota bacterium]
MIGQTVSHYKILEKLGEGGMGVVYQAHDTKLRRTVALKFLRSEAFRNDEQKARLVREAQTAAALDHPNICTIYEIDEVEGQIFISMTYVEGVDLKKRIQSGPMEIDEVVRIAIRVARGLEAAHKKGIVHRDIKSSNIMITEDGQVKIMDFGLAKMRGSTEISRTTMSVGTPSYMSPEQARGNAVDHRTDIWSLGVCLYEMFTGKLPFDNEYESAIIYSILNEEPTPAVEIRPDLPSVLGALVDKAMAKDRGDRVQSASEFIISLETATTEKALEVKQRAASETGGLPSIAVMPFADMSPLKDQEYFCDGIAEEIINKLVRLRGLRVASRTSAFAFKARSEDVRSIGRKLGVGTVLEGSVRKSGNQVRVTGQLVSVEDGYHLWSDQFDRELEDIFAIQEEIAHRVVDALSVTLSDKEKRHIEKPATGNIEAYDFYLRGRQFFYQVTSKSMGFACDMFSKAIKKDPGYALAYAGLADCHSYIYEYFERKESHFVEAIQCSQKALELDPELAEAHAARGQAAWIGRKFDEAEAEFEEAIRLNPRLFEAYLFYARMCFSKGQFERAAELFEKAELVNSTDYQTPILLAQTYRAMGESIKNESALRRALDAVENHLDAKPDDTRAMYFKATALFELGEREKALEWGNRALSIDPKDPPVLYFMACFNARFGNLDEAISYLEKCVEAGFSHREWITHDPDMDPLRDHPRFEALMDRLS